jgi:hypothetical protein
MSKAGYSGTPLAKKLGIKEEFRVAFINQPDNYLSLFTDLPDNLSIVSDPGQKKNLIHYFTKEAKQLAGDMAVLRKQIEENGSIWISWPKKASKMPTDITEDIVRHYAFKNGLVDIKVCAVDETWSALKLVIPVKMRNKTS